MKQPSNSIDGLKLTFPLGSKPLTLAGLFGLTLILPTLLLMLVDQRVLDDEALWLKPLKFQISVALLCITLALSILVLPKDWRQSLWVRVPAWSVSTTAVYELVFLAVQAGRGKRSHFNSETLFDQIAGSLMAAGASVLVGGAMVIGMVIAVAWLRKGATAVSDPLMLSVSLGLIVGGFLGGYTGSFIGMNAGPFVGTYVPSDPTVPIFGWSTTIGDLRIAHFLGLHAMQVIPLFALGTAFLISPIFSSAVTVVATAGWTYVTLASLYAAQAGTPLLFS